MKSNSVDTNTHHHQLWKYRRVVILQNGCSAQFFPSSKESSIPPKIIRDENQTMTRARDAETQGDSDNRA
jgi:hypothetical protein